MPTIPRNLGFDGRRFLSEAEWHTYCRRKPVRYIRKRKESKCRFCDRPGTDDNPLQNAHIISFDKGVIELALTPDFLDSDANIVTAHRVGCNRATELDLRASMAHLRSHGVSELPNFLPESIHEIWRSVAGVKSP